jgi:hypothetical protein
MTHKINSDGKLIKEKGGFEMCHRFNNEPCKPVECIGAEVIKHKEKKYINSDKVKIIPGKVKFYCLPQPREIILKEKKNDHTRTNIQR